ncbi:MAG: hypothetical protein EON52_07865 [Actinomycetales bacterium]|nr:MAG: hypothetical protein EON52_07865 [Actinomycetales bacterium]
MEPRCKPVVGAPSQQAPREGLCTDRHRSTYSYTWRSLVRGQALNSHRDPLEHDFVRLVDSRPWVGSAGCRRRAPSRPAALRSPSGRRDHGLSRG